MTEPLVQTRPEHDPKRHELSRHRAEPAQSRSALATWTAGIRANGSRAGVIAAACAILIGVGAAGQAAEPFTLTATTAAVDPSSAAADSDPGESDLALEKSVEEPKPAPAEPAPAAAPAPEPAPAPAPAPEPAPAPAPAPEPAPVAVAVNDPAGAQAYAASQLGAYGWAPDQMQCLTRLWTKESNWTTTATNPSSGAYGIVQSLPAEKMATAGADYLTNYRTQINWGLNYIKERYGSPCGALNFHYANNWY